MLELQSWLKDFKQMHKLAGVGKLPSFQTHSYERGREQLSRSMLAAQQLALTPGMKPRMSLRAQISVGLGLCRLVGQERLHTTSLSVGGCGACCSVEFEPGETARFELCLGAPGPVTGYATILSSRLREDGGHALSMSFADVGTKDLRRIEDVIFHAALEQLEAWL